MTTVLSLSQYDKVNLSINYKDFGNNSIRKQAGQDTLCLVNKINDTDDSLYAVFDGHELYIHGHITHMDDLYIFANQRLY